MWMSHSWILVSLRTYTHSLHASQKWTDKDCSQTCLYHSAALFKLLQNVYSELSEQQSDMLKAGKQLLNVWATAKVPYLCMKRTVTYLIVSRVFSHEFILCIQRTVTYLIVSRVFSHEFTRFLEFYNSCVLCILYTNWNADKNKAVDSFHGKKMG